MLDSIFAEAHSFEDVSLDGVLRQFNKTVTPRARVPWKRSDAGPGSPRRAVVKLHVPPAAHAHSLAYIRRLRRALPEGWTCTQGHASTDGKFSLTVQEVSYSDPKNSAPSALDTDNPLARLMYWTRRLQGIPVPPSAIPESKVFEKVRTAWDRTRRACAPLEGEVPACITLTYVRQDLEPALTKIMTRERAKGNPLKLNYVVDSIDPDTLEALEKDWVRIDISYKPSALDARSPARPGQQMDPATQPDHEASGLDVATLCDAPDLRVDLTYGNRTTAAAVFWDHVQRVVLGRCGPQETEITALLGQAGALGCLSRSPGKCLHLQFDDTGAKVVAADDQGAFRGPNEQKLGVGSRLIFPVHVKTRLATFVFTKI